MANEQLSVTGRPIDSYIADDGRRVSVFSREAVQSPVAPESKRSEDDNQGYGFLYDPNTPATPRNGEEVTRDDAEEAAAREPRITAERIAKVRQSRQYKLAKSIAIVALLPGVGGATMNTILPHIPGPTDSMIGMPQYSYDSNIFHDAEVTVEAAAAAWALPINVVKFGGKITGKVLG